VCGIFGVFFPDHDLPAPHLLDEMEGRLRHRGPDQSGRFEAQNFVMGNTRLAIVDLSGGRQPIFNEDGSLAIVFNGELYNHPELRLELEAAGHRFSTLTDTETILHAFEEYGIDCLPRLNGMFTIAIWNLREERLLLARDYPGIKPLYLLQTEHSLAFASEINALLPLQPGGNRPNWTALNDYLFLGYVPGPASPFAGIEKLPPGHWLLMDRQGIQRGCFSRPHFGHRFDVGFAEAVTETRRLLEETIHRELQADVPVGLFLSGGLDSSAIALFAARIAPKRLRSYALRFEQPSHDESKDASLVARHLGMDHQEVVFREENLPELLEETFGLLDEPFGDSTVLPLLHLSRHAARDLKVVLTGWGGDEVFAGYPTLKAHAWAKHYRKMPAVLGQRIIPALTAMLPPSSRYMSLEFKAKRFVRGMNRSVEEQHFLWMGYWDAHSRGKVLLPGGAAHDALRGDFCWLDGFSGSAPQGDGINRILELDARFFLEGNGLFQADRMTMAASLEARVPLLNKNLIHYLDGLPGDLKMAGGKTKAILRAILHKQLPASILNKPKKGFGPPTSAWLRGPLAPTLRQAFNPQKVAMQGIFRNDRLSELMNQHRDGRADHGRELWALLSLQKWYDRFFP